MRRKLERVKLASLSPSPAESPLLTATLTAWRVASPTCIVKSTGQREKVEQGSLRFKRLRERHFKKKGKLNARFWGSKMDGKGNKSHYQKAWEFLILQANAIDNMETMCTKALSKSHCKWQGLSSLIKLSLITGPQTTLSNHPRLPQPSLTHSGSITHLLWPKWKPRKSGRFLVEGAVPISSSFSGLFLQWSSLPSLPQTAFGGSTIMQVTPEIVNTGHQTCYWNFKYYLLSHFPLHLLILYSVGNWRHLNGPRCSQNKKDAFHSITLWEYQFQQT